ncbi:Protein CBG25499 [Caenorhabditis briggsae]|uniref:Protein CBG25499 n=1 Tax=Caenorhabditis briggsae TaxID=6238 RepID=B6IEN9_CAEBR|nr:Protein CBG25499 [Caenorhabditis briggsae]CAR98369.1 Protein CBG25499 [Caenorhabditis briggsae]
MKEGPLRIHFTSQHLELVFRGPLANGRGFLALKTTTPEASKIWKEWQKIPTFSHVEDVDHGFLAKPANVFKNRLKLAEEYYLEPSFRVWVESGFAATAEYLNSDKGRLAVLETTIFFYNVLPKYPGPLKQKVVDLFDYESRCNLRITSKDDRVVVDSTKHVPEKLNISEAPSDMSEGKSKIRLEVDSITIWLTRKDNLTKIDRGWNGDIVEELSEIKQESRYEIFQTSLLKLSNRCVIEADTVDLHGITCMPPEDLNFKCSSLKMYAILDDFSADWLRKMQPRFKQFKNVAIDC